MAGDGEWQTGDPNERLTWEIVRIVRAEANLREYQLSERQTLLVLTVVSTLVGLMLTIILTLVGLIFAATGEHYAAGALLCSALVVLW